MRVSGFGFRVSGFGFRGSGLGIRVNGWGKELKVQGSGSRLTGETSEPPPASTAAWSGRRTSHSNLVWGVEFTVKGRA